MINTIKSEFRKLLTIRSTYIVSALSLLLVSAISFYFIGFKAKGVQSDILVQRSILDLVTVVGILVGVTAILHICHEYRYNTISYTLTNTNNRLKILIAKALVISSYAAVIGILTMVLVSLFTPLGINMGSGTLPPQEFALWSTLWRVLAYMVGGALFAMLLGFLFRNLVFAIVMYFVLPTTITPLLAGFFKIDSNWLPSIAQNQILSMSPATADTYSAIASAGVLAAYLVAGGVVAAFLLLQRDAN